LDGIAPEQDTLKLSKQSDEWPLYICLHAACSLKSNQLAI